MKKKILLSDNDGTLFNTFPYYEKAFYSAFLNHTSVTLNPKELETFFNEMNKQGKIVPGSTWKDIIKKTLEELDIDISFADEIYLAFENDFIKMIESANGEFLFPYTKELLKRLYQEEIPVIIHTGTSRIFVEALLDKYDLEGFISGIVSSSDYNVPMNKDSLVLQASNLLPGDGYVVFGDTKADMKAGKALGYCTVWVPNNHPWAASAAPADYDYQFLTELDINTFLNIF